MTKAIKDRSGVTCQETSTLGSTEQVSITQTRPEVLPGHINQLDGLRAGAICLVLAYHCSMYFIFVGTPLPNFLKNAVLHGRSGVDLFFALSGFLITGILLDTQARPDYFKRFYWRRALRIWPLYYAFLFGALIIHPRPFSVIGFAPYALYYRNFLGPDRSSDVYFGQFWSLCVEEQFYLVWPFVIYFCPKRVRLPLIGVLMGAAFFFRAHLFIKGIDGYIIYRLPYCRMDDLLAGAAIAVMIRGQMSGKVLARLSWIAIIIGTAAIWYTGSVGTPTYDYRLFTYGMSGFAFLYGGVVGLCVNNSSEIADAVLGNKFCRAIAKRSYGMYVLHLVPLYLTVVWLLHIRRYPHRKLSELAVILFVSIVTYGMAWISWKCLESPILRLKDWEWFAKKPQAASGSVM